MTKGQSLQDPFLNLLRKEKNTRIRLPRKRHQIAGEHRFLRSVCGAAEKQRQSDGLQACHFNDRADSKCSASC